MNNRTLKFSIIITALSLLLLSTWVSKLVWAEMLTIRAQTVISQLTQTNKEDLPLAKEMILRLESSINLNSKSANSHYLLAQYYEYLYDMNLNIEMVDYSILAEKEYKKAIILQPTWESAWARLAKLHDKLNNIDKTLYSIKQAIFIASYEDNIKEIILPIVFKHWELLNSSEKSAAQINKILKHIFKFKKHHHFTFKTALNSKNPKVMLAIERLTPNKKHIEQLKIKRLELEKSKRKEQKAL